MERIHFYGAESGAGKKAEFVRRRQAVPTCIRANISKCDFDVAFEKKADKRRLRGQRAFYEILEERGVWDFFGKGNN